MPQNPFAHLVPNSDKKKEIWEKHSPEYRRILEQLNESLFDSQCELSQDEQDILKPNVVLRLIIPTRGSVVSARDHWIEDFVEGATLAICQGLDDNDAVVVLTAWKMHKVRNLRLDEMVVRSNKPAKVTWEVRNSDTKQLIEVLSTAGKRMWQHLKELGHI